MPTLFTQSIVTLEFMLLLGGCMLLWRHGLSPAGRAATAARAAAMPAWPLSGINFLLYLWVVICSGFVVQAVTTLGLKLHPLGDPGTLIVAGGAFQMGMLLGIVIFKRFIEKPAARPDRVRRGTTVFIHGCGTVLIALPVLAAVSLLWQHLLQLCGVTFQEQDLVGIFARTRSPALLTLMIVLATVVAPITEELVFRAGLFRYARTRLPRWAALVLPAVLFASLHGNLASFAPLAALGIILSLAYERTGNIAVPIVAHGLFNLNTILLIFAGVGF